MHASERNLAVVSGGTSGIGRQIANSLADRFDLALIYKDQHANAQNVKKEIETKNPNCRVEIFSFDISENEKVLNFYQEIKKKWTEVAVLVNSAGVSNSQLVLMSEVTQFKRLMEVNYLGTVYLCKAVIADMVRKRRGHIINISSASTVMSVEGKSAYSASKAAVEKFSSVLAGEIIRFGVQVNVIRPGFVLTPMSQKWYAELSENKSKLNQVLGPLNQPIDICEITRTVDFLLNTSQISNAIIDVDGGKGRYMKL